MSVVLRILEGALVRVVNSMLCLGLSSLHMGLVSVTWSIIVGIVVNWTVLYCTSLDRFDREVGSTRHHAFVKRGSGPDSWELALTIARR